MIMVAAAKWPKIRMQHFLRNVDVGEKIKHNWKTFTWGHNLYLCSN